MTIIVEYDPKEKYSFEELSTMLEDAQFIIDDIMERLK